MTNIISSLHACQNFDPANYENLITRATQYSAKLLKKPDQCRMVCMCAQLFWKDARKTSRGEGTAYHRPKEVLECLQRSLKIADVCMPQSCSLFVHILNNYMFFFERKCPSVRCFAATVVGVWVCVRWGASVGWADVIVVCLLSRSRWCSSLA